MFCKNCGSQLSEGMLFCTECGSKVIEEKITNTANKPIEEQLDVKPIVQETQLHISDISEQTSENNIVDDIMPDNEQYVLSEKETKEVNTSVTPQKTQHKKGKSGIIALILMLAIIVGVIAYFIVNAVNYNNDKNDIVEKVSDYIDIMYLGEVDKLGDMIPDSIADRVYSVLEESEYIKENEKIAYDRSVALDKEYGDNITIKFDVTMIDAVGDDAFDIYMMFIDSMNVVNGCNIDKIYRIGFDVVVNGDKGSRTYIHKMFAYEVDGDWYLLSRDLQLAFYDAYYTNLEIDELYYIENDEDYYW